jgi:preprotein translocase subunit SecA
VQVAVQQQEQPQPEQLKDVQYSAPDDPVQGDRGIKAAARAARAAEATAPAGGAPPEAEEPSIQQPTVKSEWDKTPRNAPCPCGSGKKFKLCHGR